MNTILFVYDELYGSSSSVICAIVSEWKPEPQLCIDRAVWRVFNIKPYAIIETYLEHMSIITAVACVYCAQSDWRTSFRFGKDKRE